MEIDNSKDNSLAGEVDHPGSIRRLDLGRRTHLGDPAVADNQRGIAQWLAPVPSITVAWEKTVI
jgi:hypothetical protein